MFKIFLHLLQKCLTLHANTAINCNKLTAQTICNENYLLIKVKHNKHMKYEHIVKYKKGTPHHNRTTGNSCTHLSQCNWLWRNGLRLLYGVRLLSFFPLLTASSATRFEESMSRTLLSVSRLQKPKWQKWSTHKNTIPLTSVLTCMDQSTSAPLSHPSESHCEGFF